MENKLNHFDQKGNAVMVDVSGKIPTSRTAIAKGKIRVCQEVMDAVKQGTVRTVSGTSSPVSPGMIVFPTRLVCFWDIPLMM